LERWRQRDSLSVGQRESDVASSTDKSGSRCSPTLQRNGEGFRELVPRLRLLVHDAQYSAEEYKTHAGFATPRMRRRCRWRSSRRQGARFFHHDPLHSDTDVDALIEQALGNHRAAGGADVNSFPAAEEQELTV